MLAYISLAIVGLAIAYGVHTYRCFARNLVAAKQSGLPYISIPIYTFNGFWLVTHRLWLPLMERLPESWTHPWIQYLNPEFLWDTLYQSFKDVGSDAFMVVAPGANALYVADAQAVTQITTRRNDFPKPIEIYRSVDIFGKNVVSTEGSVWRHHRKITSPPFTEKNNSMVWLESLHQAQSMMSGWLSKDDEATGLIDDVAAQSMRLSLHVISRAGFGVGLKWPHEEDQRKAPQGHTLTYKDALQTLLEYILVVILTPRWLLRISPLKFHKTANEAFVEWGKYMREMYEDKKTEIKTGGTREGMDLMGALVKGAGFTAESLNAGNGSVDPEKERSGKQLLTDDEILGNAFVFILAGHETAANTIHFSILYLAMHWSSQTRLQQDLDSILGDRPISEWSYDEDVPKLFGSMCGAVMNEELRLIPPVIGIPKRTPKGTPQGLQLGGKHVTVPADCYITLSAVGTHRNPKYWPHTSEEDLLDFRPERWLVDSSKANGQSAGSTQVEEEEGMDFEAPDKRPDTSPHLFSPPKGAYIPFSDGYRACLGRRFAQVEVLAVLAVIFKTYSVELDVSMFASDAEMAALEGKQGEEKRRAVWEKARDRAKDLLKNGMMTIITIQMRKGKVPMRFVKRGGEKFRFG